MPAVTLAGTLALAGCGGGSDSPGTGGGGGNIWTIPAGEPLIIGNTTFTCTGDTDCVITDLNNLPANVTRTTAPPEGLTSEQCGEGRIPNEPDKKMCVDDPDHVSSEKAKADAAALYAGLVANTGTTIARASTYTYADFNKAKGEKGHGKITPQGDPFEKVANGDGSDAAAAGLPKGVYTVSGTDLETADQLPVADAKSSAFSQGPSQKTHEIGDNGIFTTSGEWRGVSGTFYCTGECLSQGGNPAGSGTWSFKPGNVKDRVKEEDVTWGWWVQPAAGSTLIHVRAFVDHGGLAPTATEPAGNGSAKYEGTATGKYAVPGEAGSFTADANLTATFANQDTLSGEIKNFKDADGKDKTGWSVALQENNLGAGGLATHTPGTAGQNHLTVWTRDGTKGNGLENAWDVELYGGSGTQVSTHALGTFEAQHQGSHMVGAFGTEKKSEAAE